MRRKPYTLRLLLIIKQNAFFTDIILIFLIDFFSSREKINLIE